jgi:hypothetical protein
MKFRTKTAAVAAAVFSLLLVTGGAANAEGNGVPVGPNNKLRVEALNGTTNMHSDCSTIGFKGVASDSPIDTNSRAFVTHVCNGDYTDAYTNKSIALSKPVADVKNLSWDERADTTGAGAPRISVIFVNGDVAYLASSTCSRPFAVDSSWARADFTGGKHDCSFTVSGDTAGTYAADGTNSAWAVYAAANPDQVVIETFLIFDEPGDYTLDRIALGTNHLYNFRSTYAVPCQGSESIC